MSKPRRTNDVAQLGHEHAQVVGADQLHQQHTIRNRQRGKRHEPSQQRQLPGELRRVRAGGLASCSCLGRRVVDARGVGGEALRRIEQLDQCRALLRAGEGGAVVGGVAAGVGAVPESRRAVDVVVGLVDTIVTTIRVVVRDVVADPGGVGPLPLALLRRTPRGSREAAARIGRVVLAAGPDLKVDARRLIILAISPVGQRVQEPSAPVLRRQRCRRHDLRVAPGRRRRAAAAEDALAHKVRRHEAVAPLVRLQCRALRLHLGQHPVDSSAGLLLPLVQRLLLLCRGKAVGRGVPAAEGRVAPDALGAECHVDVAARGAGIGGRAVHEGLPTAVADALVGNRVDALHGYVDDGNQQRVQLDVEHLRAQSGIQSRHSDEPGVITVGEGADQIQIEW